MRSGPAFFPNPMLDASIPACGPAADAHSYLLEEIEQILAELPEPARTVVAAVGLHRA
jgi:hypothetical protein